jgi:hypothetical protein
MSQNNPMSMSNIVKNHFRVLEVVTPYDIVLNTEIGAGRRLKISDL